MSVMSMRKSARAEAPMARAHKGARVGRALAAAWLILIGTFLGFPYKGVAAGGAGTVTAPNGTPQSTATNTAFPVRLVAWVRDASTNPVPGVVVTFATPASGPSATFGGSTTATVVTDPSGLASAPELTANSQVGTYVVTASVPGVPTPASFNLTNTPGGPSALPKRPTNLRIVGGAGGTITAYVTAAAGTPQNATVGATFATALQATVKDSNSNPLAGINVTFAAPDNGAGATFGGALTATAVTNASGVATAPVLTANAVSGCYAVSATVPRGSTIGTFALSNVSASGSVPCGGWQNITPPQVPLPGAFPCDYGTLAFVLDPQRPSTIYLGTCQYGVYKSMDSGASWVHINTGRNGAILDNSRQWTMAIDPVDPRVIYTNSGYGVTGTVAQGSNGAWKSTNGGVDWDQIWPPKDPSNANLLSIVQFNFVAQVSLDPTDRLHVFLSWHGTCAPPYTSVCYGESRDGGATWTMRNGDPRWVASEAQTIYIIDGRRWLFANHADGLWQTSDAGATWSLIDSRGAGHWPAQLYQAANGVFYIGADTGIYRSPDGVNWSLVPNTGSLVTGLASDGNTMFASTNGALTPWIPVGSNPYLTSPEADGLSWTTAPWTPPPGAFTQGGLLAYDRVNRILYSSNGTQGFWRVITR
jgi:hypothetical protein